MYIIYIVEFNNIYKFDNPRCKIITNSTILDVNNSNLKSNFSYLGQILTNSTIFDR
ncbi:hypothetical protein GIB67_028735, partial [Kingdonia uniflora]